MDCKEINKIFTKSYIYLMIDDDNIYASTKKSDINIMLDTTLSEYSRDFVDSIKDYELTIINGVVLDRKKLPKVSPVGHNIFVVDCDRNVEEFDTMDEAVTLIEYLLDNDDQLNIDDILVISGKECKVSINIADIPLTRTKLDWV